MKPNQSDMALAERAASGEDGAWREIYTATRERLFALLTYHIGNRDEALDVLQETYVSAIQGIGRYRGEGTLESWLCGIALRRARDWKRRFLRKFKQTDAIEDRGDIDQVLPQPDPRIGIRLREALAELSERQRGALLLHDHLGYSFAEIGGILGVSESTARVHAFRAREAMKTRLGESPAPGTLPVMQEQES